MSEGRKQRYNTASRRSFLGAMLAAASAPAFVKPTSLMPLWLPSQKIVIPLSTRTLAMLSADFDGDTVTTSFNHRQRGEMIKQYHRSNFMVPLRSPIVVSREEGLKNLIKPFNLLGKI